MWIWCFLHGVCIDDHHLKIHPLCKIVKPQPGTLASSKSHCSHNEHLKRAHTIAQSQDLWPRNSPFEESVELMLKHLDTDKHSNKIVEGKYNPCLISWLLIGCSLSCCLVAFIDCPWSVNTSHCKKLLWLITIICMRGRSSQSSLKQQNCCPTSSSSVSSAQLPGMNWKIHRNMISLN